MPGSPVVERRNTDAWRKRTVWDRLLEVVAALPAKEFMITIDSTGRGARVTYGQAVERADSLAASLFGIGVRRGDRVALFMTNLVEWVYTYLATLRLGAILVPINTWFKDREVEYALEHSGARHLVLLDKFRRLDFASSLREICPDWVGSTPGALLSDRLPDLRNVIVLQRSGGPAATFEYQNAFDYRYLMAAGETVREDSAYLDSVGTVTPNDVAAIIYTSGSGGSPKGVLLEQWGLITASLLLGDRLAFGQDDKWFGAFPFFHVGGSVIGLMTTIAQGATLVFSEAHDAELEVALLERERCTFQASVAAVVLDQLEVLDRDNRTLSVETMMANQLPEDLAHLRRRFGVRTIGKQYGLTEAYGRNFNTSPFDPPELQVHTCGRALEGIELRVTDPATGDEVAAGEVGEAWLRGLVMRGYHRAPQATEAAVDADGWLHTQDLVRVDERGYLTFVGRLKAMLKVGGENVAAEEVEQCIRAMPAVFDCCVIPIADDRKDQVPLAYVSLRVGASLTSDEILAWCASRLARFKVPARVEFLDSLPLLGNNKVDRATLIRLAGQPAAGVQWS